MVRRFFVFKDNTSLLLSRSILASVLIISGISCQSNQEAAAPKADSNGTSSRSGSLGSNDFKPEVLVSEAGHSAPLLLLRSQFPAGGEVESLPPGPVHRRPPGTPAPSHLDSTVDEQVAPMLSRAPSFTLNTFLLNFDGIGRHTGYGITSAPPDTDGDVGPNHYLQIVNSAFSVFDKQTGQRLAGPTPTNALFTGYSGGGGRCASFNRGDGVVQYDRISDRWFISQFAFTSATSPPYYQCVAVSTSGDPTGSYNLYAFGPFTVKSDAVPGFNDYGKFGIWPDGYYATYNMFTSNLQQFLGGKLCALERAAMLAGNTAKQQCFQLGARDPYGYGGALPSSLYGNTPPPAGSPHPFFADDDTPPGQYGKGPNLLLWAVHIDWKDPSLSTITNVDGNCPPALPGPCPELVEVPDFSQPCNDEDFAFNDDCIPQEEFDQRLGSLGDRLMFQQSYRNFGDHQSIYVNRSVELSPFGRTGSRWYEIRNPNGGLIGGPTPPVLYQRSTYAPADNAWRWMGSILADQQGNMALGLSVSAPHRRPDIVIAGRTATDPLNTLPESEGLMAAGGGSQNGTAGRWGDYSAMTIDPTDDCTFWFTSEYYEASGSFAWDTRIANFKFDGCRRNIDRYRISDLPDSVVAGTPFTFTATALDANDNPDTSYNGTASFITNDPDAITPSNLTFSSGMATGSMTFKSPGGRTFWLTETQNVNVNGRATVLVRGGAVTTYALPLSAAPANKPITIVARAVDSQGNTSTDYAGTAMVSSSDPLAVLPASAPFSRGESSVTLTLKTPGAQTVTFTDSVNGSITGTVNITVTSSSYAIRNLASSVAAGVPTTFDIDALDADGVLDASYNGQAMISSNDQDASVPTTPVQFTAGRASGVAITLAHAGTRMVIATDRITPALTGSSTVTVVGGAATTIVFTRTLGVFTSAFTGSPTSLRVTALDAFGNTATTYNGTVHFTSSDPNAVLPPDRQFTNGSGGNLSFTFNTSGRHRLTGTDTQNGSISGTTPTVSIVPPRYTISVSANPLTCATVTATVTGVHTDSSVDTTYNGTALIHASNLSTVLPESLTFVNGVAANVPIVFKSSGDQILRVTDYLVTSLSQTASVTVGLGPVSTYAISNFAASSMAGMPVQFDVEADDCLGVRTDYAGIAHVTSSDARAVLPPDLHFVSGRVAGIQITFKTAGAMTIVATDTAQPSLTGRSTVNVSPAAAAAYDMSIAASATAGSATNLQITVADDFGNTVTNYSHTARLSTTDTQAVLPATASFSSGVAHALVTFKTAGAKVITATDSSQANITATKTVNVSAAAASVLTLTGIPDSANAGALVTFSVTAGDAYGNTATSYAGTVAFTSSDPQAVLPPSQSLSSGTASGLAVTFKTNGTQTITAADSANGAIHGTQTVTVSGAQELTPPSSKSSGCGCAATGDFSPLWLLGLLGVWQVTSARGSRRRFLLTQPFSPRERG